MLTIFLRNFADFPGFRGICEILRNLRYFAEDAKVYEICEILRNLQNFAKLCGISNILQILRHLVEFAKICGIHRFLRILRNFAGSRNLKNLRILRNFAELQFFPNSECFGVSIALPRFWVKRSCLTMTAQLGDGAAALPMAAVSGPASRPTQRNLR